MDVTMPQLGETVTEGTITKWFKAVGDSVALDEPLFEVSTDKIDSEVPSPGAGVLTEIVVAEGDTVDVGVRLAVIGDAGASAAPDSVAEPAPAPAETPADPEPAAETPADPEPAAETPADPESAPAPAPAPSPPPAPAPAVPSAPVVAPAAPVAPENGSAGRVTSPLVRKMISERGLDAATIVGSGEGGRITRRDVESAGGRSSAPVAPGPTAASQTPPQVRVGDERIPFDNIRRRTAEHMVRSKATSAHVATAVEVDFEAIERVRRTHGRQFRAEEGFGLTYLPFIARAYCDAVHSFPAVNASVDGDALVVHHDINLGIAVDLEFSGLIAPVVRGADALRLRNVAREINDLAARARSKQLGPDEIIGATFTITNMGPFGTLFTVPIINQPQVAILATDAVRKRPVVVEGPDGDDAIAVHSVGVLTLTWDHRAFDGAYAASFLRTVGEILETRDWEAELA